ncbi:MAG TPA: GatB/YqeY domain-containing protein [Candidatus Pacearchaeota archaeon]|nr:GatB/YqeY domain-containing protein [Candidatus Pacearchaeota archaeon]HPR79885.1 GatB/YqeY domain-containing protein [Candidatus Pacearchaeota archaeon]
MIVEEIKKDLISALKEKNELAVSTLRMVTSSIFNKEMEKRVKVLEVEPNLSEEQIKERVKLTDEEVIEVLSSEVKKRRDSISQFEQGGRTDLIEKEKSELEVLKKYLPKELTEDEIRKIIKDSIAKTGATTMKDIGIVMKEVSPQTKGKADGNIVAKIVREELGN